MDDSNVTKLRKLTGQHRNLVYEAVKAGMAEELSGEHRIMALAISEHMQLKHVHNALEFDDLRGGEPYEIEVNGTVVSPMAHVAMHAAVKGQIEADPPVAAAFEKLVATGASPHQAEHILAVPFAELYINLVREAESGGDGQKARAAYYRKIQKITRDAPYRKKLKQQFPGDHLGFD